MTDPEEAAIVGAMLYQSKGPWPDETMALIPGHFADNRLGSVFAAMQEMIQEGQPVDEITVSNRLISYGQKGYFCWLNELVESCPTSETLIDWSRILLAKGRKRLLDSEIAAAVSVDGDADEMASRVREAITKAESSPLFTGLEPVRNRLGAELKQLEAEGEDTSIAARVKTGIPKVDRMVSMRQGQLTIVAGRPGMGKSALAGTVAANVAKRPGTAVAMFSLEMSYSEWLRRLLAGQANCSSSDLAEMARKGELVEYAAKVHGMELWIDDRPRLTVEEIRSTIARRMSHVDLVIVDYLQLTSMNKSAERHDLAVGEVTKGLRALGKEFDCHVMALSQLNRAVEKRSPPIPQISDLRDSGNIEEDADHIWLLYRPGYYRKDEDQKEAWIIIGKQRGGAVDILKVQFWPEQSKFAEVRNEN
jgi:replicative DNA helicase